jgi:hypothetical protein
MIVLVDGYNLLRQIHGKQSNESQRSALVNLLGRYVHKRNHKVVIFFDGGNAGIPYQEKQKGIVVWFSGHNTTADDLIIEYVETHKGKDMVVVTLDRDLKNKCGLYAPSLEPLIFYGRIQELLAPQPTKKPNLKTGIKKLTDENDAALDSLMYEAGLGSVTLKEDDYQEQRPVASGQKLSKKQKLKNKILDML